MTNPCFQLEWKKGTNIPCDITWCRSITVQHNTFIADCSTVTKAFLYGPEADSWEFLSETISPPTVFFGMGSFCGNLILAGGKDIQTNESSKLVSEWNHIDKKYCNPYPPMLFPRVDPLVVGWGDYLIVIGGIVEGKQNVEIFSADKDVFVWKDAGEIPVSTLLSCVVIDDGMLYLLGDADKLFKISLPKLVSSNPAPDSLWEFVMEMPFKESTILSYQNCLLGVGGYTGLQPAPVTDVMYLNRQDVKWIKVGDLPQACAGCCCTSVPNCESIVLMGGKKDKDDTLLLKDVYRCFKPVKE